MMKMEDGRGEEEEEEEVSTHEILKWFDYKQWPTSSVLGSKILLREILAIDRRLDFLSSETLL